MTASELSSRLRAVLGIGASGYAKERAQESARAKRNNEQPPAKRRQIKDEMADENRALFDEIVPSCWNLTGFERLLDKKSE